MANNGHEGDDVSDLNFAGNSGNSNIKNTNRAIQGQGQDQDPDQGGVPYVHNGVLDMANNGHEGDGNVAGNSANSNIPNTNTTIHGQGQWHGRVPYSYNGVWYPGTLNNVETNYTYPNRQPPPPTMGMNPNGYTYPNPPPPPPAVDMNPNGYTYTNPPPPPPGMDMNPNGYTYPNPPPPMDTNQNGYTYPNPPPTPPSMDMNPSGYTYANRPPPMDMNANGYTYPRPPMDANINGYNGAYCFNQPSTLYGGYYGYYDENALNYIYNNYYYPPYADGFYQLQQQQQLQPQPRPRRLLDTGRGKSSSGHSSGRYSNAVQAGGRGRGRRRGFTDSNYTNNSSNAASLSQDVGNITEGLLRMTVSEGERSTQVQGEGEGHAEHIQHANANGDAAEGFSRENSNAKFFVLKSYSRENVVSSMQHRVWTSTRRGNKILAAAYGEARHEQSENASRPVFLFFSVKGSGNFCGVAEMDGPVDFEGTADCWDREWKGKFPVKWNIIKDVPYNQFQHITINTDVGNQSQIPVIYSRDTQQVEFEKGAETMDIFNSYASTSSLLDDLSISEEHEGEGQRGEEKRKQDNTEEERRGEKESEQSCSGSNSCDTNADHIQQEAIEDSPTEIKLQDIVNTDDTTKTIQEIKINVEATCDTEETQQTDVDSSMMPAKTTADTDETHEVHAESSYHPPKATSDTGVATQVTRDNSGDNNQIPQTIDGLSN